MKAFRLQPSSIKRSVRWLPMKPSAPVTSTVPPFNRTNTPRFILPWPRARVLVVGRSFNVLPPLRTSPLNLRIQRLTASQHGHSTLRLTCLLRNDKHDIVQVQVEIPIQESHTLERSVNLGAVVPDIQNYVCHGFDTSIHSIIAAVAQAKAMLFQQSGQTSLRKIMERRGWVNLAPPGTAPPRHETPDVCCRQCDDAASLQVRGSLFHI